MTLIITADVYTVLPECQALCCYFTQSHIPQQPFDTGTIIIPILGGPLAYCKVISIAQNVWGASLKLSSGPVYQKHKKTNLLMFSYAS